MRKIIPFLSLCVVTLFMLIFIGYNIEDKLKNVSTNSSHKIRSEVKTVNNTFSGETTLPNKVLYVALGINNKVLAIDPANGHILKRIPVGTLPIKMLYDSIRKILYVANRNSGDITVISTLTGKVVQIIPIGIQPQDMLLNNDKLYVADSHLNSIRIIDLNLLSLIGSIELSPAGYKNRKGPLDCCKVSYGARLIKGRGPFALALNKDDHTLFVGNLLTRDIAVLNTVKKKEVTVWDGAINIRDLEYIPNNKVLYLLAIGAENKPEKNVLVIDANTGKLKKKILLKGSPLSLVYGHKTGKVYVITKEKGTLTEIDSKKETVKQQLEIGPNPSAITLSPDEKRMYICDYDKSSIDVISKGHFVIQYHFPSGTAPTSLVYVSNH